MITDLASFFFHQLREAEHEASRIYEPVIGIVTDNRDPEKLLRVKVKLPTISVDSTWWVPVVSLGAGKDRGWFFLPEVNDEVLVAFEHGDINRPIVIGQLWNGQDKPPESSGKADKRTMVSKKGGRIEFDDEKNTITIKDGGGKGEIVLKADDNKLTIEAKQGDVVLMASQGKLQIVADQGIEMTATANFDVRAQQNANIGTSSAATLKASGMASVTGATTDINAPGAADAAEASAEIKAVDDPIGGGGNAGGGSSSGNSSSNASGPAPAAAPQHTERVLKRLSRDGSGSSPAASRAAAAGLFADVDDKTKEPLITSVRWQDTELAWGTQRVRTVARTKKEQNPKVKVKVTATAKNVGDTVTVKIIDIVDGSILVTASANVVDERVSWDFAPAAHGLKTCHDVKVVVEGAGQSTESPEVLHVHEPYWHDTANNRLKYDVKWEKSERFPAYGKPHKGSRHAWETIQSLVVDDVGRENLDDWAPEITPYMRKHLALDRDAPAINDPRCRYYVRDLQSDLGAVASFFDTELSLTGAGFSPSDEPSGVFGPLTFLGLFMIQRLSMYPDGANAGATRGGNVATLTKDERLPLESAHTKRRPIEVDDEIAKLLQAWVVNGLQIRVGSPDFEQVPFKFHGRSDLERKPSTQYAQRRIARRYQMWILAVELLGGFFPDAGPHRPFDWPLWRKYSAGRSAASNHEPGLAMDFNTNEGGVVPYSLFVYVKDGDRFQLWENLHVARRLKAKNGYPKQPADHLSSADRQAVASATATPTTARTLDAAFKRSTFAGIMIGHAQTVEGVIKKNTEVATTAKAAVDAAFKKIFKGLSKDEKVEKLKSLAQGNGSQDEQAIYAGQKKNLQAFLVANARNRVLAVEHERFVILSEFAGAKSKDDTARKKLLAELRDSITDLEARSMGHTEDAPPFEYKYGRAKRGIRDTARLAVDQVPDAAERSVLGSELIARKEVLATLEATKIDGDAMIFEIEGDFVRLDQVAEQTCKLYRIARHDPGEWECWHYQYFDPKEKDPHLQADAFIVEMARELGPARVINMLQVNEVEGVLDKEERKKHGTVQSHAKKQDKFWANLAGMYEWWRSKHPTESNDATKVHYTGITLAELTKPTG